jgi:hypothetical protein
MIRSSPGWGFPRSAIRKVRCVWKFLPLPPKKDWRLPFRLPKRGPENFKRIVARGGESIDVPPCIFSLSKIHRAAR